jgi:hypothetical protein
MRFLTAFFFGSLVCSLSACTASSAEDDDKAENDTRRTSMRSEVEGTWSGAYSFTDGRAATTMTLALVYNGSAQTKPQCGTKLLTNESGLSPNCITQYSLPLRGTLSTADGQRANEVGSFTYDNLEGLRGGGLGASASLTGRVTSGRLEGNVAGGGSFVLTRQK